MCGIGGFFQINNRFDLNKISGFFKEGLIHRGPDVQDHWVSEDGNILIAHTRLSILDLSVSANQPMKTEDGKIVLTFNGEIYNYAEIKKELCNLNKYNWFTHHSDTEVILHAYEEWGIECISRFRGIFAIGIWDQNKETLYVVRDRFGVKPVYYISKPDHFGFASELKPFFKINNTLKLNKNGVIEYLTSRGSIAPNTMIEDIFKLDKGHYITIKKNKLNNNFETKFTKYYDLNNNLPLSSFDFTNKTRILEDLEEQIITSIKYRWISDTPVCLFLSGGIDSSLIAAISSKLFKEKVHAFTVGLPGNINDETSYAKMVAEQYNLDIHILNFSQNPLNDLNEWLYVNDDLLSDPAAFAIFHLSKEIRNKGFKVVLSGEGSDEIFAGYDSYLQYYSNSKRYKNNRLLKNIFYHLYSVHCKRNIESYYEKNTGNKVYFGAAHLQTMLSLKNLFTDKKALDNYFLWNQQFFEKRQNDHSIDYALKYDLEFRIPNDLLLRTDRATMAYGVEARVPFLDHKLVEYAMSIPYFYKTGKNFDTTKLILKELALKYFKPEFVYRPKQGFPIPVNQWLLDENVISEFDNYIGERKIDCLNYDYIRKIYQRHKSKKDNYADRLFNIYLLEKYIRFWGIS
ncbi:MAG: asparagine synthase (glutamine-hydrolyzing) [Bacteroidetes bacterium]|nr:asparagine synthase (glutamine-hydrolyzing) [Bacteroidota bacterium]